MLGCQMWRWPVVGSRGGSEQAWAVSQGTAINLVQGLTLSLQAQKTYFVCSQKQILVLVAKAYESGDA